MTAKADKSSTSERRDFEKTRATIAECHEYHNRLQQVTERAIEFDLYDGNPHNYVFLGDILT